MITIPQRHRQTDKQTDGQLALILPRSAKLRGTFTGGQFTPYKITVNIHIGTEQTFRSLLAVVSNWPFASTVCSAFYIPSLRFFK